MLRLRKQVTKRDVLGFRLPMLTHEEPALDITDITVIDRTIRIICGWAAGQ
jgi:DNA polymerase V